MILFKDGVKYIKYLYKNESEIEEMIFEHSKNIFGEDSLLLAKRKIKTNSGIGTIPDAFVISLDEKKWYLIEVELKNHPLYEHIVPQISKFNTAIKNSDSQKKLIKMIYEEIKDDPRKNLMFQLKNIKEVYKYIAEILESKPQIIILIDGKNDELEEVCDSLPFDSKVIEFKTYTRENVGLGVHVHSFEPLKNFKKIKPESNDNEIKGLTETQKKRIDFWKGLLEINKNKIKYFANNKAKKYYDISCASGIATGTGYYYAIKQESASIGLYIQRNTKEENDILFNKLLKQKNEIEKSFGQELSWLNQENMKSSWIFKDIIYAGLKNEEKWENLQNDMVNEMVKLTNTFDKYIKELD
jgi:hypothetical protein